MISPRNSLQLTTALLLGAVLGSTIHPGGFLAGVLYAGGVALTYPAIRGIALSRETAPRYEIAASVVLALVWPLCWLAVVIGWAEHWIQVRRIPK